MSDQRMRACDEMFHFLSSFELDVFNKKKQEENKQLAELEETISHRFINLTSLLSQKAIGKDLQIEEIWWTPM